MSIVYAIGWLLVQYAIHHLGFGDFTLSEIEIDQNRKPRWRNDDCDFNVTHAGSLVACAVSANSRVGIDCERVRPVDVPTTLRRILSSHEQAPARMDLSVFFRLWTQKEAVIKAESNGGVWNMRQVALSDGVAHYRETNWYVYPLSLKDDYVGHVASDRAKACITMHAVSVEDC